MSKRLPAAYACLVALFVAGAPYLAAHDSPEHVIETLNARMAREGRSAALLYRRAGEYRELGRLDAAAADCRAALRLDPAYLRARGELARILLAQNQLSDALAEIEPAIRSASSAAERAGYLMVRSDLRAAQGQWRTALDDCQQACRAGAAEVDWLLSRSRLQYRLGLHDERVTGLAAALEARPSAVLKNEWIEALLDAGRAREALAPIEAELAESRWQSSWLLRRARARQQLGQNDAARVDLQAAVEEINGRLNPRRLDLTLLADRGLAKALLGDWPAARADLQLARSHSAPAWTIARLQALVDQQAKPE